MKNFRMVAKLSYLLFGFFCVDGVSVAQTAAVDWSVNGKPDLQDAELEKTLDQIMSGMTLEQKVAQMIQPEIGYLTVEKMREYGFGSYLNGGNTAPYGNKQAGPAVWMKFADEMYEASVDASIDGSSIPTIWGTDAMHGHSNVFGATLFPHNIGLGAMRDPALIEAIGVATAKEVAATGIEWSFAPTVAVVRDDRWGRTYESYSEDPQIVAQYAGKMVMGIQGHPGDDFLQDFHRIATAKHFIGDGGTQSGIDRGDTRLDEATLRDIHAAGYFSALRAGVQSVMASFNSWNGERVHGSKYLLTDVLKGKMGFDGFVVSDWNAHKFVDGCDLEQCAAAINAGVDVLMVPEHFEAFFHNTVRQVRDGEIPLSRIDDAVRRFLRAKIRWGVLTRGKPSQRQESKHPEWFNAPEHRAIAEEAVRKSLVLLKNNHSVLPIKPTGNILVAGAGADNIAMQAGGWSVSWQGTDNTNADFPHATSIYAGLKQRVESAGGSIELSQDGSYSIRPDVAVVVIGEQPYAEWFGDRPNLLFKDNSEQNVKLLKRLNAANIPVVTVFLSGRPLWVNNLINHSDAFVAAWLPGSEGQGVADVILSKANGDVNFDFTGKLSFSWPKYDNQYVLNIHDADYAPLFPYNYGLSYSDSAIVGLLNEDVSPQEQVNIESKPLFVRNLTDGMKWALSDAAGNSRILNATTGASPDGRTLLMQTVNLAFQEDGRKFIWNNPKPSASARLMYTPSYEKNDAFSEKFLNLKVRLDRWQSSSGIHIQVQCTRQVCQNEVTLNQQDSGLVEGNWVGFSIATNCQSHIAKDGNIDTALNISSDGDLSLAVAEIALVKEPSQGFKIITCEKN